MSGKIEAFLHIDVESNKNTATVVERLKEFKETQKVFEVSGKTDIVLIGSFLNTEHFNNFVDNVSAIDDVKNVESLVILGEK